MTHHQADDPTIGALVHQLTTQVPDLIRSEMRLAQAEVTEKGKAAGVGIGIFSVAGLLAFFGVATLITTAVLALANVVDAWLAALIVAMVLLVAAALAGVLGKNKVASAAPPRPELAMEGLKEDLATVKGNHRA
jgi:membrane protein